ncbi:hypothetical protein DFP73DRAFT_530129 [Morchella snyderi]|nr:hypothetical protein DFP73DRAFT_530129 [Morchella snyderi]
MGLLIGKTCNVYAIAPGLRQGSRLKPTPRNTVAAQNPSWNGVDPPPATPPQHRARHDSVSATTATSTSTTARASSTTTKSSTSTAASTSSTEVVVIDFDSSPPLNQSLTTYQVQYSSYTSYRDPSSTSAANTEQLTKFAPVPE